MARVEKKLVGRNAEQRFGELPNFRDQKVLNILRCQNNGRFLFTHTLHSISDVLNGGHIGQVHIQLVYAGGCVANAQKLVGHIGKNVKEKAIEKLEQENTKEGGKQDGKKTNTRGRKRTTI